MRTLLMIILSVLLPPLAVALQRGLGFHLLLNIVLTLLAWLPGVIHALWVLFSGGTATRPAHA